MRVGVIGSGISGLTASWLLSGEHAVTLFESNDYIGGHTHTIPVDYQGQHYEIDTGFIVFNDWTYPNFIALLDELGVASQPTSMGFSVRNDKTGIEYAGTDLKGLFAQKSNLLKPSFYRMLRDILRFNREAPRYVRGREDETVGEFLQQHRYSREFAENYLLPMGAAIWSCPMQTFAEFPIRFIIEFYINHGLLLLTGRPIWRVIQGGSARYVERLIEPFSKSIRLNSPVQSIKRYSDSVIIKTAAGCEQFDEVILACHSDQAVRMLEDADPLERDLLSKFPYSKNIAILHTDESVLPRRRQAWASWNYHVRAEADQRPSVTYNMNILQSLKAPATFNVTLNEKHRIDSRKILGEYQYSHPIFTVERKQAQSRHREVIRHRRTSYCGAYWGNGFHEDGVVSAMAVGAAFGILPPWQIPTGLPRTEQRIIEPAGIAAAISFTEECR